MLARANEHGFETHENAVRDAVGESASLLGAVLAEVQIQQACDCIIEARERKVERQR